MFFKHLKINLTRIFWLSILLGVIGVGLGMFIGRREMALTTMGEFGKEDAVNMGLETQWVYGWPKPIVWWGLGIARISHGYTVGNAILVSIFFNIFSLTMLLFSVAENLVFWWPVAVVVVIAMEAIRFVRRGR